MLNTTSANDRPIFRKGIADEQLAKVEQERGRKRERNSEDPDVSGPTKRMRSASSDSVSTISTSPSRSLSPPPNLVTNPRRPRSRSPAQSPPRKNPYRYNSRRSFSRSPSPQPRARESEKKRRRDSGSSVEPFVSDDGRHSIRGSREREGSRSTRRKFMAVSPPSRGRKTQSRSPYRARRPLSNDRQRAHGRDRDEDHVGEEDSPPHEYKENRVPPREKSLSPFSKRLALTQAMNWG